MLQSILKIVSAGAVAGLLLRLALVASAPARAATPTANPVSTSTPTSAEVEKRVGAILARMTLEEKVDYISGVDAFYVRANKRLGLPALRMADGPFGVRNVGPSTAYAAGIGSAASVE